MKSLVIFITYWTFQIKFYTKIHRCIKIFLSKTKNWVYFLNTSGKTLFMELARPVPKIYRGLLSHRPTHLALTQNTTRSQKLLKHTHRYKYPANTLQFLPTLVHPKLWATYLQIVAKHVGFGILLLSFLGFIENLVRFRGV